MKNTFLLVMVGAASIGVCSSPATSFAQDAADPVLGGKTIAEWTAAAQREDGKGQVTALWHLGQIGPRAKRAIPVLIELLASPDEKVRATAAYALGRMGPDAKPALPRVLDLLHDSDADVRQQAIWTIGFMGPAAKDALPNIIALLNDKVWSQEQVAVILALGHIGTDSPEIVVPVLLRLTLDPNKNHRGAAIHAFGKLDERAKAAAPIVATFMNDADIDMGFAAIKSVQKLDPSMTPMIVPVLIHRLKSETFWERRDAAKILGDIGPEASAAVPELTALLRDQGVQNEAAEALENITRKRVP